MDATTSGANTDARVASRELDARVAEQVMGIPRREVPRAEAATYSDKSLREGGDLWTDIVRRAIGVGVVLRQTGAYKGVSYGADFDGWRLSYHLGHSDSYRADEEMRLTGEPENWLDPWGSGLFVGPAEAKPYSTDIAAAWEVVAKVQRQNSGWRFSILGGDVSMGYLGGDVYRGVDEDSREAFGWHAEFFGHIDPRLNYGQRHGEAYAETPALAICLAALAATDSTRDAPSVPATPREQT